MNKEPPPPPPPPLFHSRPPHLSNPSLPHPTLQIRFLILFSRQGKVRLSKWYVTLPPKERGALTREVTSTILARPPRACSVLEVADFKVSVWFGGGLG